MAPTSSFVRCAAMSSISPQLSPMRALHALMCAGSLAVAAPTLAQTATADPRVRPAFGNTIVSTYRDGRTGKLWLDPGGAYRGLGRTGRTSIGTWRVEGDRLCMRQRRPFPAPFSYCTPIVPGGVGARWTGRAPDGEPINIELVAGRQN